MARAKKRKHRPKVVVGQKWVATAVVIDNTGRHDIDNGIAQGVRKRGRGGERLDNDPKPMKKLKTMGKTLEATQKDLHGKENQPMHDDSVDITHPQGNHKATDPSKEDDPEKGRSSGETFGENTSKSSEPLSTGKSLASTDSAVLSKRDSFNQDSSDAKSLIKSDGLPAESSSAGQNHGHLDNTDAGEHIESSHNDSSRVPLIIKANQIAADATSSNILASADNTESVRSDTVEREKSSETSLTESNGISPDYISPYEAQPAMKKDISGTRKRAPPSANDEPPHTDEKDTNPSKPKNPDLDDSPEITIVSSLQVSTRTEESFRPDWDQYLDVETGTVIWWDNMFGRGQINERCTGGRSFYLTWSDIKPRYGALVPGAVVKYQWWREKVYEFWVLPGYESVTLVEALMKGVDYPYLFEKVEYPTPPWRKRGGISV